MAATLDIPKTVSLVDALWTLYMCQTKAVRKEIYKRVMALENQKSDATKRNAKNRTNQKKHN